MKTYTLTALFVIALVLAACQSATPIPPTATLTPEPPTPTPTVGPGGFPLRFHVEGNAFMDQYGQKMVFRGMASPDPVQMAIPHDPNLSPWNEHYYEMMASWGANVIRLPIVPYSLHNYDRDDIYQILDQTTAWAAKYEMYVIIELHSVGWLPTNTYNDPQTHGINLEEFLDFWRGISERYADNDAVAFYELFNEPGTWPSNPEEDWKTWKGVVDQAVTVIRQNDPDKIILVGGLAWGYDLSQVAANPIDDRNMAYGTQPYGGLWEANNLSWDDAFGNLSSTYPVFVTEFGYDPDLSADSCCGDPDINGIPYHLAIIDYLEARQISWVAWIFDADWEICLLADNLTFEPTPMGEYFRSRLLELN
jgi:endoglucanase